VPGIDKHFFTRKKGFATTVKVVCLDLATSYRSLVRFGLGPPLLMA
jgi:hypothetical protein